MKLLQRRYDNLSKFRKRRNQWKNTLKILYQLDFKLELWQLRSFSLLRQVRTVVLVCTVINYNFANYWNISVSILLS
jgi:hypothetical protein